MFFSSYPFRAILCREILRFYLLQSHGNSLSKFTGNPKFNPERRGLLKSIRVCIKMIQSYLSDVIRTLFGKIIHSIWLNYCMAGVRNIPKAFFRVADPGEVDPDLTANKKRIQIRPSGSQP